MIVNPYIFNSVLLTNTLIYDEFGVKIFDISGDIFSSEYANNNNVYEVVVGTSCTIIGSGAFYYCTNLKGSFVIPSSVTTIGQNAFSGQVPIGKMFVDTPSSAWPQGGFGGYSGAFFINNNPIKIYVSPDYFGVGSNYDAFWRSDQGLTPTSTIVNWDWYPYPVANEDGPVESTLYDISDTALVGLFGEIPDNWNDNNTPYDAARLEIGTSCTSIGSYAFNGCTSLTGLLTIPESVETIGSYAFYGCDNFAGALTLEDGVQTINSNAFQGCTGLDGILTIANSVTTIGSSAFRLISINTLSVLNELTTISSLAFSYNTSLTDAFLAPPLSSVDVTTFTSCNNLTKVYAKDAASNGYTIGVGQSVGGETVEVLNWDWYPYNVPNEDGPVESTLYDISDTALVGLFGPIPDNWNDFNTPNNAARLEIGKSCTSIGIQAFQASSTLTGSLTIPDNVLIIGDQAFNNTNFNGTLTIENGVESIGNSAFSSNDFTGSLVLPDSLETLGSSAFYNTKFTGGSLTIPDSVTSIGQRCFRNTEFTSLLSFPNNISFEIIPNECFSNCSTLTGSLVIPDSVTSIGNFAFSQCFGLTGSLTIGNSVETIGSEAFYYCNGFTGPLTIPDSVRTIKTKAFRGCSAFDGTLTIENGVESIENSAFYFCTSLTGSLTIPDSVTSIGSYAFIGCEGLNDYLVIPNIVTSIGNRAFDNCAFDNIYIDCAASSWTGFNALDMIQNSSPLIYVNVPDPDAAGYNAAWKTAQGLQVETVILTWQNYPAPTPNPIDPALTYLYDSGGSFLTLLQDDIPNNWNDNNTPYNADRVDIGTSCTSIGNYAFSNSNNMTAGLVIPSSVLTIGDRAFNSCTGLTGSLTIPDSVDTIGSYAFNYCTGFTGSLTIENGVQTINSNAFNYCYGFTGSLTIPDSVTTIGSSAFYAGVFFGPPSWSGALTIGDGIETLGSRAFAYCSGFTSLTIGNVLTSIGDLAFKNCNDIIHIYINCGSDKWTGSNALQFTTALTKIYINAPDPDAAGYNAAWRTAQGVAVGVVIETWNNFPASTPNP